MVDEVRNKVKGKDTKVLIDVLSFDIQRGRDHGLPTYGVMRKDLFPDETALTDFSSFEDGAKLDLVYDHPDDLDLIMGIMGEPKEGSSILGKVGTALIKKHFDRLRKSDRFWYERTAMYHSDLIANIKTVTLEDVMHWVISDAKVDDGQGNQIFDLRNGFVVV